MSAKEDLLRKLSEQRELRETRGPDILAEWRQSLTGLFRQFTVWLAEPVANKLLTVEEIVVDLDESRLGRYQAPSLKIGTPQGAAVYIVPKARFVAGSLGRVDFESSPRKVLLVRNALERWQFAHLTPDQGGWTFEELSEDSFWKALQYLLS